MPFIFIYLVKLSISLAVVYMFYHFVLRRLTFYNWNRWFLLGYSALSFVIPFIDINPVLQQQQWQQIHFVQWVPAFGAGGEMQIITATPDSLTAWDITLVLLGTGMLVMAARLSMQYFSYRRMLSKASLLDAHGPMKLYQVDGDVIPFSFGNSIFINPGRHTDKELGEIILHEYVHVKQRHSMDILWAEMLCLLNWYNPFAWLIRRSIRQNLEFIADNQVLENGIDRKQYQYLLLKVIGNDQFSIASKFNFSSLKKRIAMMNKMKTAGMHLVKFLFILPLVAVLLLAFRNQQAHVQESTGTNETVSKTPPASLFHVVFTDSVPAVKTPNDKGYLIDIKGVNGHCVVVVHDKSGKELERVSLDKWKEDPAYHEKYGVILPPDRVFAAQAPLSPLADIPSVTMVAPTAPVPPATPIPSVNEIPCAVETNVYTPVAVGANQNINLTNLVREFEITKTKAVMFLKNGKTETYNLTNTTEKKAFEKKYGRIYETGEGAPVAFVGGTGDAYTTAISPSVRASQAAAGVMDYQPLTGAGITGDEDIIVRITSTTTEAELKSFIVKMKEIGVDLVFTDKNFNDGKLTSISGTMKSGGSSSNFSASDFKVLILAMVKKENNVWFKVSTKDIVI